MRVTGMFFARVTLAVAIFASTLAAQEEKPLPPPDRAPHLILAHQGPHAPVRALAFSPDGNTLYVGGFDKQVRRYQRVKGEFKAVDAFRVPIGPGNAGFVNAIAVSPDGKWVAVAGRAPIRGETWTGGDPGIGEEFRRFPAFQKRDAGVVYLFDPANPNGGKVLRGQQSEVRAMAFANPSPARGPVLVTAGIEWSEDGKQVGTARVFDVDAGKELAAQAKFPASTIRPGLAAWATGEKKDGLRVVVAWDGLDDKGKLLPCKLLTWDNPGIDGAKLEWEPEGLRIAPLAVRVKDGKATELLNGGYYPDRQTGGLNTRPASGGPITTTALKNDSGQGQLPTAIGALSVPGTGDGTAVLLPAGKDAEGLKYELRLLTPGGARGVKPGGFHPQQQPVMTASADGRFIALAGFRDNRVEVYDTVKLAANNPAVETLKGGKPGFSKVVFLEGEKLWLGGNDDTEEKGGVILDLGAKARIAAPRGADEKLKIDAPAGVEIVKATDREAGRVVVTFAGAKKTITLEPGEQATAAVLLPGKPAWNAKLGPIVAVAQFHERTQTVMVTIYDVAPDKPQPLCHLDGPALPVKTLAFSGSRPLLAGAGDDGTVAVWSLKNFTRELPTIEGLHITLRDGNVVVASVQPTSAADGKLKPDEVIESVADSKGVQRPVKTPLDFVLTVRTLKRGDNAQVKVKGQAAVAVPVGVMVGIHHPLFTLWVDPEANAKDGNHNWVGWTAAGPYDTNGEAAESRIGWITATGDPARPVSYAPAAEYRKTYYQPDFIRALLETAELKAAYERRQPPKKPTLLATWLGKTEERDGRRFTRAKLDGVQITVSDPDHVLDFDRAELRWQVTAPAFASEWVRESFTGGKTVLDLSKHGWKRGEHRIHIKLFKTSDTGGEPTLLDETAVSVDFIPPRPVLAVKINGKDYKPGDEIETDKGEVEVSATVEAGSPEGASVTISSTGGKLVELRRKDGAFEPEKVKLQEKGTTVILVTAMNVGGGKDDLESSAIEARVRKLPVKPPPVPAPTVKLEILTPFDFRPTVDEPFIVRTKSVLVRATVTSAKGMPTYEWIIGDKKPVAGKFDAGTNTETREITLEDDKPLTVQVRAQVGDSPIGTDSVRIVFDELPDISVIVPNPAQVTSPELNLSGGLKVRGKRPFKVRVIVTSARNNQKREFDPTPDATLTKWDAGITLFPGENWLGYVIKYDDDRKEMRREGLIPVWYLRPPAIAGILPINAGTGAAGDLTLAAVSADAPPTELWVNGTRVGFRPHATPLFFVGVPVWVLQANSVSVNDGEQRLNQVAVAVKNADGESRRVNVNVLGGPPKPVAPPEIRLIYKAGSISADQDLGPVGEQNFKFELRLLSEARLTRVEVWHAPAGSTGEEVGRVNPAAAVAVPGGFELTAALMLKLQPGVNRVRVLASNGGQVAETAFTVSYAPPAVRVVIDTIKEPNGQPIPVRAGSAGELRVEKGVIDVAGHVEWDFDDEPVGRDPNLSVVFSANGVAHLPVQVAPAKGGKERKFTARVYLNAGGITNPNAAGTIRLKTDLRSGGRPLPIPREQLSTVAITVTSKEPIRRQRFHLVMIGVEVPESERRLLIRDVITSLGGELPKDNPNFTEGRFTLKNFEFAYLYSPRLGYTKSGDLNALLNSVRADIAERSKRPNDEWVNDVIWLYYHGADWREQGRWMWHSATTLSGAAGKNLANYAIRTDDLPQGPGLLLAVPNVESSEPFRDDLLSDLPYLRFAWKQAAARKALLPQMRVAFQDEQTLGKISDRLTELFQTQPAGARPTRNQFLPEIIGLRVVGGQKP